MIIDSHHHFWRINENDHVWPTPDLLNIYKNFELTEFKETTKSLNISGTVLVQSQPSDLDTDYLLESTKDIDLIKAIVGWTDFTSIEFNSRIDYLLSFPKFKSLRPMLQNLPQDDWILREDIKPAIKYMVSKNLCFDALVFTRHLPYLYKFAVRNPELKIVIDHMAKPPIANHFTNMDAIELWKNEIARIAKLENIYCKISGLYTEMGDINDYTILNECIDHVLNCFGANRLMWGSDWPVINLKQEYTHWHEFILAKLKNFNETDKQSILWQTANDFYNLGLKNGRK